MSDDRSGALYIREAEVERLLPMNDAIAALDEAFRAWAEGKADNRPRARVSSPNSILHVMSAIWTEAGVMGLKAYTASRQGVRFKVLLYDVSSGRMLAMIEADRLGQIRTGAASGVATRYMARAEASTVGILGAGWQARSQLQAVCAVRPVGRIRAYSRTAETLKSFCSEMTSLVGVEVEPAESGEQAVRGADIVVTATTSRDPVLHGAWLEPGQHINAVGSNQIARRELDTEAIQRSTLIAVDSKEQARLEAGDLMAPLSEGRLAWEDIVELASVVAGRMPGRNSDQEITLFKSLVLALEDIAVARVVYQRAVQQGIGERLPFE